MTDSSVDGVAIQARAKRDVNKEQYVEEYTVKYIAANTGFDWPQVYPPPSGVYNGGGIYGIGGNWQEVTYSDGYSKTQADSAQDRDGGGPQYEKERTKIQTQMQVEETQRGGF